MYFLGEGIRFAELDFITCFSSIMMLHYNVHIQPTHSINCNSVRWMDENSGFVQVRQQKKYALVGDRSTKINRTGSPHRLCL